MNRILAAVLRPSVEWLDNRLVGPGRALTDPTICGCIRTGRVCGKPAVAVHYGVGWCDGHEAELTESVALAEAAMSGLMMSADCAGHRHGMCTEAGCRCPHHILARAYSDGN
jgi:hypothetical protein